MNTQGHWGRGILLVGAGGACWGITSVVAKSLLMAGGFTPIGLVSLRTAIAALCLFTSLAIRWPHLIRVRGRDLPYLASLGIAGMALSNFTFYTALNHISVAVAVLIIYTSPIIVMVASALLWGEPILRRNLVAIAMSLIGCTLVVRLYEPEAIRLNAVGLAAAVVNAFAFAFYNLWGKRGIGRFHPWTMLTYSMAAAMCFWLPLAPPWQVALAPHPGWVWGALLFLVVAGTIIPFACYLTGLQYISATQANLAASVEPVVATLIAFLVLGERLESWQLLGGGAIVVGISLLRQPRPK